MAQEVAMMERYKIRYEKLKAQSDRFLVGLNIRLDRSRIRGAVASEEDDCCESPINASGAAAEESVFTIKPADMSSFVAQENGGKVILLAFPCVWRKSNEPTDAEPLTSEFEALRLTLCIPADVRLVKYSCPVCVCGGCENPDAKLTGALRSIIFLLKTNPSVVITRGGGLLGMWSPADGDLSGFIRRYI
jgi:hypothetical protein